MNCASSQAASSDSSGLCKGQQVQESGIGMGKKRRKTRKVLFILWAKYFTNWQQRLGKHLECRSSFGCIKPWTLTHLPKALLSTHYWPPCHLKCEGDAGKRRGGGCGGREVLRECVAQQRRPGFNWESFGIFSEMKQRGKKEMQLHPRRNVSNSLQALSPQ